MITSAVGTGIDPLIEKYFNVVLHKKTNKQTKTFNTQMSDGLLDLAGRKKDVEAVTNHSVLDTVSTLSSPQINSIPDENEFFVQIQQHVAA